MASIQETLRNRNGAIAARALTLSSREAAEYIEQMCSEMVSLADEGGLGFLAYLLEVAREEASLHCSVQPRRPLEIHGELPPPSLR